MPRLIARRQDDGFGIVYLQSREASVMHEAAAQTLRERNHSDFDVIKIKDEADARVSHRWAMEKVMAGDFGQLHLGDHDFFAENVLAGAFDDGFDEFDYRWRSGLSGLHEGCVLAEVIEEKLPDTGEIIVVLQFVFELFQTLQFHMAPNVLLRHAAL
jgi:hypothetical protein